MFKVCVTEIFGQVDGGDWGLGSHYISLGGHIGAKLNFTVEVWMLVIVHVLVTGLSEIKTNPDKRGLG